jgi:hypothetical protein
MADQKPADNDDDDDSGPPRGALAVLVVMAVLIAVTLYVVHRINQGTAIQDCVAAGRTNCAPIAAPGR